jgi:hypothetical protein
MTTSSSFEIVILGEHRVLYTRSVDALAVPHVVRDLLPLDAGQPFAVVVRRTPPDGTRLRLRLGTEAIAETQSNSAECSSGLQAWLRDEFGESRIVVEREVEAGTDRFETVFELGIAVSPRPEVTRDFRVMIEDLAAVHKGLAQDVVGRSMFRSGWLGGPVTLLYPEALVDQLETLFSRLEHSLDHIARQPSVVLDRTMRQEHYRGGSRTDTRSVSSAARDPRTRLSQAGRIASLGKVVLRGMVVSEDLPEHRHIADGLRRLSVRAESLAGHCERAAELLQAEEARWGHPAPGRQSVFEQRDLPRLQALRELAGRARSLAGRFRHLLEQNRFLAEAGPPRTPFGPTPAFLGRAAYREVYRALLEARQFLGVLVDADEARLVHRNLADLYEYWCFVRTIAHLRDRFGAAGARQSFSLIDDIYRPELAPGQEFRFALGRGAAVVATYQPEILPWREARQRGERYGASLTANPLRPDIILEILSPLRPPVMLVLDAKSTDAFATVKLRDMTDYARQVFEIETNRQPVRQVFLLHRDREARTLSNLPGYLRGRRIDRHAMALGAVPCVPERVGHTPPLLALVIDRFLQVYAGTGRFADDIADMPVYNDRVQLSIKPTSGQGPMP